ncbi:hypothetical protein CC78DRAFT_502933, partial [Lojkania enalia]
MNKFKKPEEEDFETVSDVVKKMMGASHGLMAARSQYDGKHKIDFTLRGVPVVSQFVSRDTEMQQLKQLLLDEIPTKSRRRVVVLYGLGGVGKTQLAVEFAREHHRRFSGIFWLDGSSEASLARSFVGMMQRLPRDELIAGGAEMPKHSATDVDVAVRKCLQWLSLSSNDHWLLIYDNVDRNYLDKDDQQAYNVNNYFPYADHGSILITSRLASLQTYGSGVKVGRVSTEQARIILENNARRVIEDVDIVLKCLDGLPLALTQAGSYLRETNMSALAYKKRYKETWEHLMKSQGHYPLEEYGNRSVLTTWTMSYEQARRESEEAAHLLKLWGFLDCGELWYELVAAGSCLADEIQIPMWLHKIAGDELEFANAVGLLSRYSLIDANEDTGSHSMHSVLHRWCAYLVEDEERSSYCNIAAGLVASNVPTETEAEFGRKWKRILAHGVSINKWIGEHPIYEEGETISVSIKPWAFFSLGYILSEENRRGAETMYQRALQGFEKARGPEHTSTLGTVNNLGSLYWNLGRLDEAEKMYQRALQGFEKAWGPEHTSTLDTVNNLGLLYADLGRLDEAEKMYQRALQGKEKAWGPEHTSTL